MRIASLLAPEPGSNAEPGQGRPDTCAGITSFAAPHIGRGIVTSSGRRAEANLPACGPFSPRGGGPLALGGDRCIAGRREPLDHAAFSSFRLLPPFSYNLLEAAKHLIEGMVFKHQQDDVLARAAHIQAKQDRGNSKITASPR